MRACSATSVSRSLVAARRLRQAVKQRTGHGPSIARSEVPARRDGNLPAYEPAPSAAIHSLLSAFSGSAIMVPRYARPAKPGPDGFDSHAQCMCSRLNVETLE